jgi:catechol 2,3-dioxygenase-like lactoylglutathione lyase family enzyme
VPQRPESWPEPSDLEVVHGGEVTSGAVTDHPADDRASGRVIAGTVVEEPPTARPSAQVWATHAESRRPVDVPPPPRGGDWWSRPSQTGDTGGRPAVRLVARDAAQTIAFYRDLLGFEIDGSTEGDADGGEATPSEPALLRRGDVWVRVEQSPEPDALNAATVQLTIEVTDVHAEVTRLRECGVHPITEPRVVSRGEQLERWAAVLRDPNGNTIALTRWELRP